MIHKLSDKSGYSGHWTPAEAIESALTDNQEFRNVLILRYDGNGRFSWHIAGPETGNVVLLGMLDIVKQSLLMDQDNAAN